MNFVGNEMMSATQKMDHNQYNSTAHSEHEHSATTSMKMHCADMGHYDHSGQCSQHSSHGGCSDNACSGGVVGALSSTSFTITDYSNLQRFDSLPSIEHQGYPNSLYRPPIA